MPLLTAPTGKAAAVAAIAADLLHTTVLLHLLQLKVIRVIKSSSSIVTGWERLQPAQNSLALLALPLLLQQPALLLGLHAGHWHVTVICCCS
jgi:hypothetical protein